MQPLKLVMSDRSKPLWAINDKGQTLFRKITEHGTQFLTWERKKDAMKIIDAINTHGLEYVEEKLGRKAYLENVMVTGGIEADLINIDEVMAELKAIQIMRGE